MAIKPRYFLISIAAVSTVILGAVASITAVPSVAQTEGSYLCADITFGEEIVDDSGSQFSQSQNTYTVTNLADPSFSNSYVYQKSNTYSALRFGSSSNAGTMTITFEESLDITSIRILASTYSSSDGNVDLNLALSNSSTTYTAEISNGDVPDFTAYSGDGHYTFSGFPEGETTSITVSGSGGRSRFYLYKIIFTLNEDSAIGDAGSSSSSSSSSASSSSSPSSSSSSSTGSSSSDTSSLPSYYDGIDWTKTGAELKTELYELLSDTVSSVGYRNLWSAYATTDVDDEGYIVDMYSSYRHTPPSAGLSSYDEEGDGVNREHIVPQSVFNTESGNIYSDLFNVYPTDGAVNRARGNYPHAEVDESQEIEYESTNGCMLGTSAITGLSGTVFEVPDQWKGDVARSYFYSVTCYQGDLTSYSSFATFSGNTYPSLSEWAVDLYLKWNDEDPVDDWERERNEKVYSLQGNRNPFIDYEYAAHLIWDSAY